MTKRHILRPAGFDDLGLRRALGDRMLPLLVAAMAFLAALALAGSIAAEALARHWQEGAAAALTVQVPQPTEAAHDTQGASRTDRVLTILRGTPGIASARALTDRELADLLRPWLGDDAQRLALPLPGVIEVHLAGDGPDLNDLGTRLAAVAPGTIVESHGIWVERLAALARSLQACAWGALLVVAAVAASVITVATRAGLVARREAIEIVHGLGATDGYIAGRFSRRASTLAAAGGIAGACAALPVLLALATLAAPFLRADGADATASAAAITAAEMPADAARAALDASAHVVANVLGSVPPAIWLALPALPLAAWAIGFATAQITVRRWLRRLP